MNNETLCSANLFFPEQHRKSPRIAAILKQFNLGRNDFSPFGNTCFDIEGYDLEDIREKLVKPLVEFLDSEKRSSLFFRDQEGRLATILIIDGELIHS